MDIVRSKAGFRVLRELVGLTQSALARMVGVNVQTVKYWENPDKPKWKPNERAWELVVRFLRQQAYTVKYFIENLDDMHSEGEPVVFKYYRSQADYDRLVGDGRFFGVMNAVTRAYVQALLSTGVGVEVRFAGSDTP